MKGDSLGQELTAELVDDSKRFFESGKAYQLLQEFFNGFSLEMLRSLLPSNDLYVRRTAVWIVSELGSGGCELIEEVLQLRNDKDRYVQYHVLEIIAVCALGKEDGAFAHVVRSLESDDEVLRSLAMRLVSKAQIAQLKSTLETFDLSLESDRPHAKGLLDLADSGLLEERDVLKMLNDTNPIVRKYGAMAAKRLQQQLPALIVRASESTDADIRKFAQG
jgi:HEAT repeat protein